MIVGKIISGEKLEIPLPNPTIQGETLVGTIVPSVKSKEYIIDKGNEILNEILFEIRATRNPTGFRRWVKVDSIKEAYIGQELSELTPMEIVGYEVYEAGSPLALGNG